ncbi:MAG: T9SS type A sorting domain-containing protein, partial [Ignavibacteriaceae bacterium]
SFVIGQSSFVSIKVYDVLGNEIATLVNEEKPVGSYEVEFDANKLSSGIYFYQLQTESFVQTRKMLLLK